MKRGMILLFFLCCLAKENYLRAQAREEFNGPYNSWANIKLRFGARGDGRTDDTRALQQAIDSLTNGATHFNTGNRAYTTVYLPAGIYCVSSTLVLKGKIGIDIIGEDPLHTVIKWTGGNNDTILWANASAYFKISRLSWDANGRKGMQGIGIHWKEAWNNGTTRSFAALNIEISDNYFLGAFKFGISGGTYQNEGTGANDSEVAIRRCIFNACTDAGIEIHNFNALDYWIWDCKFLNCGRGIWCSKGGYHVYRSYFSGTTNVTVNDFCYYTSVRGCYIHNTSALSLDNGASCNPFKRVFQDNTVTGMNSYPVRYYHLGRVTLWDNRFAKSSDTAVHSWVYTGSWCPGVYEILSIHNQYETKEPFRNDRSPMKNYVVNDGYTPKVKDDTAAFLKTMETCPAKVGRSVLEVPAGAGSDVIQSLIDQAAALKGQRPVVHFAAGSYYIDRALKIPTGCDMQLAGDGYVYASVIERRQNSPFINEPMILVKGPSYITIRNLQLGDQSDKGRAAGVVFGNVDQPGAQAHLDQVYTHGDTSLVVDGMNYLYVQKDNSFFTTGNYINGGELVQQGKGTSKVCCYGGEFTGLFVNRNASFLARDCWWEGAASLPLDLSGSGSITIDGAMIAPAKVDSTTTVRIGKFSGSINLMNMYLQGGLSVQGANPDLRLLAWNIHFYHKMDVLDFLRQQSSYKGAFLGLTAQCFKTGDPSCQAIISIPDQQRNVTDINTFLDTQTTQDRTNPPQTFKNLSPGISNINISRVCFGGMNRAVAFTSGN